MRGSESEAVCEVCGGSDDLKQWLLGCGEKHERLQELAAALGTSAQLQRVERGPFFNREEEEQLFIKDCSDSFEVPRGTLGLGLVSSKSATLRNGARCSRTHLGGLVRIRLGSSSTRRQQHNLGNISSMCG